MTYDIAIIGGGPAGMIAAGRAGELGAKVVLLEKNSQLGTKLLLTGGGRCNLTNLRDNRQLADSFGRNGRWLLSGLSKFGSEKVVEFFNQHGLATKMEDDNRIFPQSNRAQSVLRVLMDYLAAGQVDIRLGAEVKEIITKDRQIDKLILADDQIITAKRFIICTGGQAYPATGSTGIAYEWLKKIGHQIAEPRPALVSLVLKDKFIKDLEGLSLPAVRLSCYRAQKRVCSVNGPVIFTANGLSGPAALNLSRTISREDLSGLTIQLDLFPELNLDQLDQQLQADFSTSNKLFKTAVGQLVPPKLVETLISLTGINAQKKLNSLSRSERQALAHLLKEFNLSLFGLAGFGRAMITAGGVELSEIDPKNMGSKLIENLYLAGEILDLDGPTGGYNLQVCWTSGYLAGENAAKS